MNTDHSDKITDHHRLQLSALVDGELAPDEARFLLRRLQHDDELAGCWERWQLCGDVLRGQARVRVPSTFAGRVAEAIAAEQRVLPATSRRRWLGWSGGALAAGVAVVALMMGRQAPGPAAPAVPAPIAATTPANPPVAPAARPELPTPPPDVPDTAGKLATAVAVAEVPRRAVARRSRGQQQRAAVRAPVAASVTAVASAATPATTTPADPFSTRHTEIQTRPWPRALLPNATGGALTVDYAEGPSQAFYPFQPRATVQAHPAESDRAP